MYDLLTDILLLITGAIIALIGNWVHAWIDRQTTASNTLYQQRVESLNSVWTSFLQVKGVYARKVTIGHDNWVRNNRESALNALNDFRSNIDRNQVILPKEVLKALRDIDMYLFEVLNQEDQPPSKYLERLNYYLAALSTAANKVFSKKTHKIDLEFHT